MPPKCLREFRNCSRSRRSAFAGARTLAPPNPMSKSGCRNTLAYRLGDRDRFPYRKLDKRDRSNCFYIRRRAWGRLLMPECRASNATYAACGDADYPLKLIQGARPVASAERGSRKQAFAGRRATAQDTIVVMRNTGMRNARELYRMRVENSTSMPEPSLLRNSKTESGRRLIPMSDRVRVVLQTRVAGRTEGLVWQSHYKRKRIGAAVVNRRWVRAREAAGLPANLVNYCARMTTAVSSRQRLAT